MSVNLSGQLSRITEQLDTLTLQESHLNQETIRANQKTIEQETDKQISALNSQGYVHLTVAVFSLLCLAGAIIGASLKNTAQPAAGAAGALNFRRVPTTPFAKIAEVARNALIKSHERLPDAARAVEQGSQMVTGRFENKKVKANARIREEDLYNQELQQAIARMQDSARKLEDTRGSIANSEAASMRSGG